MSTTVQYKGNTLTTVSNATKTLKTAGKYMEGDVSITDNSGSGQGNVWQDAEGYLHLDDESGISLQTKSATPSETAQTITADEGYYALDKVNIGAISSSYVGSGITRRSSSDMTVSGATVTAPSGYYSAAASKSVASMTLPTAASTSATSGYTKKATIGRSTSKQYINIGTGYNNTGGYYEISAVANGSASAPTSISGSTATVSTGTNTLTLTKTVSVTPVVSAGYVSSGTATNSSVSLTASVAVNPTPTASGATVTIPAGYYSAQTSKSVASGTAGTPTATKGTVSNHSVSVTPSVTNTTGYISGSTKTGTAVSVSASELVSGTKTITANGTGIDVTNYADVTVNVSKYTATITGSGNSTYCVVKLGGNSYYQAGSFGFNSGQTVFINANGVRDGNGYLIIDGETVASGPNISNYSYTLPECDITIDLNYSGTTYVTITTSLPKYITKTITQNGTYNAEDDSADGYSSVTVNVSGGGGTSNYVRGTFTGITTGAAMDISVPYSGDGYPIAITICVSEGAKNENGTFYNTLQRYAVVFWAGNKENTETPTYVNGYSPNFFTCACRYKSSDTTVSTTANYGGVQASTLANMNAAASRDLVVRMKSPTVMSVYIASTSYGFMANTEYTYHIMYSS